MEERVKQLEEENRLLRQALADLQKQKEGQATKQAVGEGEKEIEHSAFGSVPSLCPLPPRTTLSKEDVTRYGRQLLMPEIGAEGQKKLCQASVLIVGAGGLGAPAALYLAGAGIGRIGIVDFDAVEMGNLHRQVIHSETKIGISKAESAKQAIKDLNSSVECVVYNLLLNSSNALQVIEPYDVVLDATDNVATRYLLNDACVLLSKVLVSGSALRAEGQLTVYHHRIPSPYGPCYRCLYPKPPPVETVTNCSDGGVIGAVPGVIGCLQALEAIKIMTGNGDTFSQKLLLYNAMTCQFRVVKLRPRNSNCSVCGDDPTIKQLIDYEEFCQSSANDKARNISILEPEQHITCEEFKQARDENIPHVLLDVRSDVEFAICSLPDSLHIQLKDLPSKLDELKEQMERHGTDKIFTFCRRGNDSQRAVKVLDEHGITGAKNIKGGITSWGQNVDPQFPVY